MTGTIERNFAPLTIGSLAERSAFWLGVAAQHGAATTQTPREATGRWRWERSKPARLAVRDHHRRSLCGKSSAQSEQWYCWIGRRRIISASAENAAIPASASICRDPGTSLELRSQCSQHSHNGEVSATPWL